MPMRNRCLLAAVVCVLAGELASAQQSGLSERMRQQTVRPPQRQSSSPRVTTFSGVQPAAARPVTRQVPMREKIRPAVLTRELPADAGAAAAGGRPIELLGFNGDVADDSEFLETLETPPPQTRVTKRTAPAVAESGCC